MYKHGNYLLALIVSQGIKQSKQSKQTILYPEKKEIPIISLPRTPYGADKNKGMVMIRRLLQF